MKFPNKKLELKLFSDYRYIIGVDEVGMGSLAGPVVVCAVLISRKFFQKNHKNLRGLRDSKLLSVRQREKFAARLMNIKELKSQISICYPKTIDRLNIYQASRLAMRRAVSKLARVILTSHVRMTLTVLVDGSHKIFGLPYDQIAIVKGDRKVFAIACASIIAKAYRDRMMTRYAKKFPKYGFEKHKGYGTRYHQAQLISFGPSPIHRVSFAPMSNLR